MPAPRLVVLGASNVTRGLTELVASARTCAGPAPELLLAHGHGRSYGLESAFLGRVLPPIATCGLWQRLEEGPPPRAALLADVGNDLAYGVPARRLLHWVELCADRLIASCERVTLLLPPRESLLSIGRARFYLFRTLFFPGRRLSWRGARQEIVELDEGLRRLVAERAIEVIEPEPGWYGFDPIHLRRSRRPELWRRWLVPGPGARIGERRETTPLRPVEKLRLRSSRAERCRVLGVELEGDSWSRILADGTRVSFH